jgi:hypothetical protein
VLIGHRQPLLQGELEEEEGRERLIFQVEEAVGAVHLCLVAEVVELEELMIEMVGREVEVAEVVVRLELIDLAVEVVEVVVLKGLIDLLLVEEVEEGEVVLLVVVQMMLVGDELKEVEEQVYDDS